MPVKGSLVGLLFGYAKRFVVILLILFTVLIFILTSPNFFSVANLLDILKQGSILSLVALAMTMVLIIGGLDMSVGAITDFSSNLCAAMLVSGKGITLAIGASVLLGGLSWGLLNAIMVVAVGMPAFIATVGTMFITIGVTFALNGGKSILLRDQDMFFGISQGTTAGIPNVFIIILVLTILLSVYMRRFKFGSNLYAVGSNPSAAAAAGITLWKPRLFAFLVAGAFSGIAGVLQASYISGSFALGSSFEFLITAFAAAFLGSTLIRQGELNPVGTVIAAMFISSINNALTLYGTSHLVFPAIEGAILILALLMGNAGKGRIGQMAIL